MRQKTENSLGRQQNMAVVLLEHNPISITIVQQLY